MATEVKPVKPVPEIMASVPTWPDVGVKLTICGVTVKFALTAIPFGAVTLIVPDTAFAGTEVEIEVDDETVYVAGVLPPEKETSVAPMKPVPAIVTAVPEVPVVTESPVIVGAGVGGAGAVTVSEVLVTEPVAVATITGVLAPVDEPAGTVTVMVPEPSTE